MSGLETRDACSSMLLSLPILTWPPPGLASLPHYAPSPHISLPRRGWEPLAGCARSPNAALAPCARPGAAAGTSGALSPGCVTSPSGEPGAGRRRRQQRADPGLQAPLRAGWRAGNLWSVYTFWLQSPAPGLWGPLRARGRELGPQSPRPCMVPTSVSFLQRSGQKLSRRARLKTKVQAGGGRA